MENSQIEEPNYLDGRDVYEPVFDEVSQVGTGTGTGPAEAEPPAASPFDTTDAKKLSY